MSRPIVLGVAALLLFTLGFLAANTHVARGVIFPVTAYEADVNKDTRVNIADVGLVASKYGQTAPTATPVPLATPTPTSYCNLSGRALTSSTANVLGSVDFSNCELVGTQFGSGQIGSQLALYGSNFQSSDLSYARMESSETNIAGADFSDANLTGATLTNLVAYGGTSFRQANLTNATLSTMPGFSLSMLFADFTDAITTGTDVSGVAWNNTTCPDGTNSDSNGGSCIGHGFAGTPLATYTPTATPTATATPETCVGASANARWTAGNGHCYLLFLSGRSWTAAKSDCESIGAYLATMASADENSFVVAALGGGDRWIGFTDAVVEGQWEWITGEPATYTNWGSGEPNDGQASYPYEDGALLQPDGHWNDGYDPFALAYVCERDS